MKHDLFSLKGKVAIVTGGSRGTGKVVAGYLAGAGADIVIFNINDAAEAAGAIAKEYGIRAMTVKMDVTKPDEVDGAINEAAEKMGTLDLLFNNAGICLHKNAIDVTPEEWLNVVNVNLNGIFFVARAFGRYLIAHNKTGNIVNTASMSGTIVNIPQGQASYNSSKAGVAHLTKSLAVEWAPCGIRVNSISPGYIRTEMTGNVRQDWQDYWVSTIPFRRMGTPEELNGAVIYLLCDASTYTSGHDLIINECFTIV